MIEFPEAAMRIGGVPKDVIERHRVAWAAGDEAWREKVAAGAVLDGGRPVIALPDVESVTLATPAGTSPAVTPVVAGDGDVDPLVSARTARAYAIANPDSIPDLIAAEESREGGPRKGVLAVLRQAARKAGD